MERLDWFKDNKTIKGKSWNTKRRRRKCTKKEERI